MVIFSGFWAGFISGALCIVALFMGIAVISAHKQDQQREEMLKFLNNLDDVAKEVVKGEKEKRESNN